MTSLSNVLTNSQYQRSILTSSSLFLSGYLFYLFFAESYSLTIALMFEFWMLLWHGVSLVYCTMTHDEPTSPISSIFNIPEKDKRLIMKNIMLITSIPTICLFLLLITGHMERGGFFSAIFDIPLYLTVEEIMFFVINNLIHYHPVLKKKFLIVSQTETKHLPNISNTESTIPALLNNKTYNPLYFYHGHPYQMVLVVSTLIVSTFIVKPSLSACYSLVPILALMSCHKNFSENLSIFGYADYFFKKYFDDKSQLREFKMETFDNKVE